jgi:transposase
MPQAISYDLRLRAVDLIHSKKHSVIEVARMLKIARSSLYRWLNSSSLKTKPRKGKPSSFKRTLELKAMVLNNPSLTGHELSVHFGVSQGIIYAQLKKLGFSYKKKSYSYKEACAQKKRIFKSA